MDPSLAPGVGTTVEGGLSLEEGHAAMDLIHRSGRLGSLDIVELNPLLDRDGMSAALLVDLVARLFGESAASSNLQQRAA
jgi:arginase